MSVKNHKNTTKTKKRIVLSTVFFFFSPPFSLETAYGSNALSVLSVYRSSPVPSSSLFAEKTFGFLQVFSLFSLDFSPHFL